MSRRTRSSRGGTSGASKSSIGVTPFRVDAQAKIRRLCEVRIDDSKQRAHAKLGVGQLVFNPYPFHPLHQQPPCAPLPPTTSPQSKSTSPSTAAASATTTTTRPSSPPKRPPPPLHQTRCPTTVVESVAAVGAGRAAAAAAAAATVAVAFAVATADFRRVARSVL